MTTSHPFARVGGHQGSEVVLQGDKVRRRHLVLIAFSNSVYCIDLVASAKNGKQSGYWMDSETPLQIGVFTIHARVVTPEGQLITVRPQASDNFRSTLELNPPRLEVVRRGEPVGRFLLRKQFTCFGRSPGNRIWVRSQYLSQFHLLFVRDETGLWLVDLLSANKPIVNGYPRESGPLRGPSTRILVGTVMLKLANLPVANRADRDSRQEYLVPAEETQLPPISKKISEPGEESFAEGGVDSAPVEDELDETSLSVLIPDENHEPPVAAVKAKDSLADLLMQLSEARSALASERTLVSELREHVARHAEQESRLEQRIAEFRFQLNAKEAEIRRLASEVESAQTKQEAVRKELAKALAQVESFRADAEAATRAWKDEERIRGESDRRLEELHAQLNTLESSLEARYKIRQDEFVAKIRQLEKQLLDQAAKVEQEMARNDLIRREAEEKTRLLEQKCLELQAAVDSEKSRNISLQDNAIREEKRTRIERDRELEVLRSEMKALESDFQARFEALGNDHKAKVSQLEKQLRERDDRLEQEKARLELIRHEADENARLLQQKCSELNAAVEEANSRYIAIQSAAEEKSRRLERQCLEQEVEIKKEKARCASLQSAITGLEHELTARAEAESLRLEAFKSSPDLTDRNADSHTPASSILLSEKEAQLNEQAAEIELAKEQLERARTAFERELAAGGSQLMVLMNLDRDRRERSWWNRLLTFWRKRPDDGENS